MALRTCVRSSAEDWRRMQDELVSALAGRGVLHCAGVTSALLDTAEAMTGREWRGQVADDPVVPGAP